jgi:AraC family transcriptional regulator
MDYFQSIQNTLDYIEDNISSPISLQTLALISHFSPFHYHKIFQAIVGDSVMEYVRKRRLSKAALELINSNKRIIDIALDNGFNHPESFNRAFRKHFGMSPGMYRKEGITKNICFKCNLQENNYMKDVGGINMEPNFVNKDSFMVIGVEVTTDTTKDRNIEKAWKELIQRCSEINCLIPEHKCFGIESYIRNSKIRSGEFTYTACFEVSSLDKVPEGMVGKVIPANTYAVFTHIGSTEDLDTTYNYIYGSFLLNSGYELCSSDNGNYDFEYYNEDFKDGKEDSKLYVYIPVKK